MKTRSATAKDIAALEVLVNKAYRGDSSKKGWTTEADILGGIRVDRDRLLQMIASEGRIEVLEDHGVLRGCVFLRNESPNCYLGMLAIDPDIQGKGLGKILLNHAEEVARRWQCTSMRMTVIHLRQELLDYYKRFGYKETGKVEPFPTDPRFGIPKIRDIKLLELAKKISKLNEMGAKN